MNSIVNYFQHISSLNRSLMLAGGLAFFLMIEYWIPLFKMHYKKVRHAGLNLFFTLTTVIVNFLFAFFIIQTSKWTEVHHFGLLNIISMPLWLYIILGLMLLDLISAYWIHYIQHKVKWMWKFHVIHHSDNWVDTTTANRHHPGESVFRAVFTLLAVFVSGAPVWMIFLYQSLSALLSQFNHANIKLPEWIDKPLSWIIVSPNMHKVHHHYTQPLTDTNYGNIFSIWDRLFRTFAKVKDINTLKYGIDTHPEEHENNSMISLLQIPFKEYRPPAGSKFSEQEPKLKT